MIMHNQVGSFSGAHGFSADGKNWSLSPTAAYTKTVRYEDGAGTNPAFFCAILSHSKQRRAFAKTGSGQTIVIRQAT
jgi:hypothetical protein